MVLRRLHTKCKSIDEQHTYSARNVDNLTSLVIDVSGIRLTDEVTDSGVSALYLSQESNEMFVSLIKQLRESADIKIFSDLLQNINAKTIIL